MTPSQETLTAVDLFSGAGGMSLGLERAGFRVVLAADCWGPASASYRRNFTTHRFLQTFPDSFEFVGTQEEIAAQVGNAVPPLFAEHLGRAIAEHLSGCPSRAELKMEGQLPLFRPRGKSVEEGADAR